MKWPTDWVRRCYLRVCSAFNQQHQIYHHVCVGVYVCVWSQGGVVVDGRIGYIFEKL